MYQAAYWKTDTNAARLVALAVKLYLIADPATTPTATIYKAMNGV